MKKYTKNIKNNIKFKKIICVFLYYCRSYIKIVFNMFLRMYKIHVGAEKEKYLKSCV